MDIAKNLKNLRTENGLTQKELGERLNIGQATIACYESGQREPHVVSLIAYADFFECSIDFLVGRSDDFGNVTVDINGTKYGKNTLTEEERELLNKFKKLNASSKHKLIGYLDAISETN